VPDAFAAVSFSAGAAGWASAVSASFDCLPQALIPIAISRAAANRRADCFIGSLLLFRVVGGVRQRITLLSYEPCQRVCGYALDLKRAAVQQSNDLSPAADGWLIKRRWEAMDDACAIVHRAAFRGTFKRAWAWGSASRASASEPSRVA